MTSKGSRFKDANLVIGGLEKVFGANLKLFVNGVAESPLTKNATALPQSFTNLGSFRKLLKDINANSRTNPQNVLVKSGLVLENVMEFSKAAAIVMHRDYVLNQEDKAEKVSYKHFMLNDVLSWYLKKYFLYNYNSTSMFAHPG